MRAHGTRACYVFGVEPGADRSRGCRCGPCLEANRAYARELTRHQRRVRYGIEPPRVLYVDAAETRAHIAWLRSQGVGLRRIGRVARLSRSNLDRIATGRRQRITPGTAERVLAVGGSRAADGALVDAAATWRLLDELIAHGHTRTHLAALLGSTAKRPALQTGRSRVLASTARRVEHLHRRLMVRVEAEREQMRDRQRGYRAKRSAA